MTDQTTRTALSPAVILDTIRRITQAELEALVVAYRQAWGPTPRHDFRAEELARRLGSDAIELARQAENEMRRACWRFWPDEDLPDHSARIGPAIRAASDAMLAVTLGAALPPEVRRSLLEPWVAVLDGDVGAG